MMIERGSRGCSAWVLLALVGALAGCNQDRAIAVRTMNAALEENKIGRSGDAINMLKEAAKQDGSWADPQYYLGMLHYDKMGQPKEAEGYFKQAIERDPENPQFYYKLGITQAEQGNFEDAVTSLKRCVELKPDFAKAWFRLGMSQSSAKKYRDAVDSLMSSIKADPQMRIGGEDLGGAAYHELADLYLRFDFDDRALKVYEDGLKNNPESPRLHQGKGVAQLKLKSYEEAARSFEGAIKLNPGMDTAYFNLAVAEKELGRLDDAKKHINDFLSMDRSQDGNRRAAAAGLLAEIDAKQQLAAPAP
jgi:tetratricopeptide (TPR) repeat protein